MRSLRLDRPIIILVVSLLLLLVMPSSESLWIDEAATARLASKATFHEWRSEMATGHFSEHQMPISMAFAWLMAKALGTSEWQLRAVNIFWGALAVVALYRAGRRLAIPWLPLLLVLHPFFWYYMNEARPYVMQMACGSWLFYSLLEFIQSRGSGTKWAISLSLAGFVLCGSSLLGVIPFSCVLLVFIWVGVRDRYEVSKVAWSYVTACLVMLIPLGLFYAWTLTRHVGGAKLWPVSLKNVAFALYEIGGFTGLGPGRESMRDAAARSSELLATTFTPYLPDLLLLAVAYLCFLAIFWFTWKENEHKKIILASSFVVASIFVAIITLAFIAHWPFWGRHFAAILPFVVVVIAIGLTSAWRHGIFGKAVAAIFLLLFAVSSLEQRFGAAHSKDDYRSAAAIARSTLQAGHRIWWVADISTGTYYRVPLNGSLAISADELIGADLGQTVPPDLVVYSKADVFDREGKIDNYLRAHDFKVTQVLPAFQIFERPADRR
jgi:hypothetical protein